MRSRLLAAMAATMLAWSGCGEPNDSPGASTMAAAEADAPAVFVNRVWVVAESKHVAPGSLRVFLTEGTLVMASPYGRPALGRWQYEDESLTITEEGLEYDVEILELNEDTFRIRIHSPAEPVEIRFEPAEATSRD